MYPKSCCVWCVHVSRKVLVPHSQQVGWAHGRGAGLLLPDEGTSVSRFGPHVCWEPLGEEVEEQP